MHIFSLFWFPFDNFAFEKASSSIFNFIGNIKSVRINA